jgi:NAD+ diphosphatase
MLRESIYKRYIPRVALEQNPTDFSWWFIFYNGKILIKLEDDSCSIPYAKSLDDLNISSVRTQYLGTFEGKDSYSVEAESETLPSENMRFMDLRTLYSSLEEDLFFLAGKASQIVSWDQTHQYCGRCGTKTETLKNERAKVCPKCGFVSYPRISPAVITAILKDGKILLAHNKAFRGNMYSLIAGFVESGETLEECVKREIMEEVGIKVKNVTYFGSQPWPFPNSLMVGFTAEYESGDIRVDGVEIGDAGWFEPNSLPGIPTSISIARKIIDWYIENHSKL